MKMGKNHVRLMFLPLATSRVKTIFNYYTTNIQSSNSNHNNNNKLFISDPGISQVHSTAAASFHYKSQHIIIPNLELTNCNPNANLTLLPTLTQTYPDSNITLSLTKTTALPYT